MHFFFYRFASTFIHTVAVNFRFKKGVKNFYNTYANDLTFLFLQLYFFSYLELFLIVTYGSTQTQRTITFQKQRVSNNFLRTFRTSINRRLKPISPSMAINITIPWSSENEYTYTCIGYQSKRSVLVLSF